MTNGPPAKASDRPPAMPHPWVDDPSLQPDPWVCLLSKVVHPVKVAVMEAFLWIGEPLSKSELTRLFGDRQQFYMALVSHHVDGLDRCGILEVLTTREFRGATKTYYFFPHQVKPRGTPASISTPLFAGLCELAEGPLQDAQIPAGEA